MQSNPFGNLPTGEPVDAITLETNAGASLRVITLGGIVTSLCVPDRDGRLADVVLGFDHLEPYLAGHPYFGAITGRVAGRIPDGRFTVDGKTYELAKNDGQNHLHGGLCGLDKRLWKAEAVERADGADSLRLTYRSPDGEEGYPGAVDLAVTYTLTDDNVFIIESEASSDRTTPVSLTHHSYFNLSGEGSGDICNHELTVFADRAFVVDKRMTPLGRTEPIAGSDRDFSSPCRLADALPHLFDKHGDCYMLPGGNFPYRAAHLSDPVSGRSLTVSTTEFCLQIYTATKLDGSLIGKSGRPYLPHTGVCLECEGYPGGVDHPEFGSILVEPGQPQRRVTRYAFSTNQMLNHE
jgi:aldose 1-epimerase